MANNKLSTEEFIKRARTVHGDKYDYSKTVYINSRSKVIIICKTHGEFYPRASTHLTGRHGCHACKTGKLNTEQFIKRAREIHGDKYDYSKAEYKTNTDKILYYISINNGEAYKVGVTNRSVESRFNSRDLSLIKVVNIINYKHGRDAYKAEQTIIADYKHMLYDGDYLLESVKNSEIFKIDVLGLDEA